jgi:hypothetical protein
VDVVSPGVFAASRPPVHAPAPGKPEPVDACAISGSGRLPTHLGSGVPFKSKTMSASVSPCHHLCLRSRVRARVHAIPRHGLCRGRSCLRSPGPRALLASNTAPSARVPSLASGASNCQGLFRTAAPPLSS